jgi:predicted dehydrogenase
MDTSRRAFITGMSLMAANMALSVPKLKWAIGDRRLRVVLVGCGIRGTGFWGRRLMEQYPEILEFVGLCDTNPGRLQYALNYIGIDCPVFTSFDRMLDETHPDLIIVSTTDATHDTFIIKGLDRDIDVLTEKPLTTDEKKCQAILDAERRSSRNLIVGFNYRWSPYMTRIKELLSEGAIGKVTSVDFNWMLNTYHGASYFRRWHGLQEMGGTLWVHKATHHFDLLNWWLDSDPEEVTAYGDLEHYGENNSFRGDNCRTCPHAEKCDFHFDITKSKRLMDLYVANEHHDGYIRDNCLFRREINIYDKMSAQIKYANNVVANYSLTTYSPYEGWRIAFNGTGGRIEAWQDIPYFEGMEVDQSELHAKEMTQEERENLMTKQIIVHKLWNEHDTVSVKYERGGHGGGDKRLQDKIFLHPEKTDPFGRSAGIRDGIMSILIGVAARKSIEAGEPVRISSLTDLRPRARRLD